MWDMEKIVITLHKTAYIQFKKTKDKDPSTIQCPQKVLFIRKISIFTTFALNCYPFLTTLEPFLNLLHQLKIKLWHLGTSPQSYQHPATQDKLVTHSKIRSHIKRKLFKETVFLIHLLTFSLISKKHS